MNEYLESELNKAKDHIQCLKGKKDYITEVSLIVQIVYTSHFISTASSFEELVTQFQLRLFRHHNNGGAPLYDPSEMETFAPTLFRQVLKSIMNTGMSKDRQDIQRKRTVALMHILAYFRYILFWSCLSQQTMFCIHLDMYYEYVSVSILLYFCN